MNLKVDGHFIEDDIFVLMIWWLRANLFKINYIFKTSLFNKLISTFPAPTIIIKGIVP